MPTTYYAPAMRASAAQVRQQHDRISSAKGLGLVDAVPLMVLVLNTQRQFVYGNQRLLQSLGLDVPDSLLGMRPGEIFRCISVLSAPGGCGTGERCRNCGALEALISSLEGRDAVQECRLRCLCNGQESCMDLRVWAKPLQLDDEIFSVFSIMDIGDEKRRESLERLFFHDVLNKAGGIMGIMKIMAGRVPPAHRDDFGMVAAVFESMVEEILGQKLLREAESHELVVRSRDVSVGELLPRLAASYRHHESASGKGLEVALPSPDIALQTDPSILSRALGNMLKNALEATPSGQAVTLSCSANCETVCFEVHNPTVMSPEVQQQVFTRSFSTKGQGRGLGTYGLRLLTEQYLGGRVYFRSTDATGTVFCIELPSSPRGA